MLVVLIIIHHILSIQSMEQENLKCFLEGADDS